MEEIINKIKKLGGESRLKDENGVPRFVLEDILMVIDKKWQKIKILDNWNLGTYFYQQPKKVIDIIDSFLERRLDVLSKRRIK